MMLEGAVVHVLGDSGERLSDEIAVALAGRGLRPERGGSPCAGVAVMIAPEPEALSAWVEADASVVVVLPEGADEPKEPVAVARVSWGAQAIAEIARAAAAFSATQESNRQLRERMEELSRSQDNFAAIVSHDLRTPITTLRLANNLLRSQLASRAPVDADEMLDAIARGLDRMEVFVEDMLEAWRLAPGVSADRKPEPVALDPLVSDLVAGLFPVAIQKDIGLDFVKGEDVGSVLADERGLGQVVSNLVGNALKFTPKGGTVTVRTRPGDGGAILEIADTGPGIAEEDRDKLFVKFGRGSAAATGGESSTGLGLYICKEIIERYGGRIWYDSELGRGTSFFVYLRRDGGR